MTDEVSVETTGETVGEAKWAAVRELERALPGLDRDSISFQVVSEGERGLLGVGFTPARVIASAIPPAAAPAPGGDPTSAAAPVFSEDDGSEDALVRQLLERTLAALGVQASIEVAEADDQLVATLVGSELGTVIGRHGQMIDALQYLANAISHRAFGEDRRRVVIDAADYRARRAEILEESARRSAERASASGRSVALDPMSAAERRIVHESLKDDPEVETASEGVEPNRYVVVVPRRSVD